MMDRNREARRGNMAAVNGGGSSRRRQQRNTYLRDSPEEEGAMEMQEPARYRDRGVKKDREWERDRSSSSSKRRRGERLMHGNNREEGDDSSGESMDDDDDGEEEDAPVTVRLPSSNSVPVRSSLANTQPQNHHNVRRSTFPARPVRQPPASWKVAEEMIGVSIPKKARTSSLKRSQECWVSGGGGNGSGELIHRHTSTSPGRLSPSSNTAISPPSSTNFSVRKKKQISGSKHRPPKMGKTPSLIQEIEMEVAQVLFGMKANSQDINNVDSKDTNGVSVDAKSLVSSPNNSTSQTPATSQPSVFPSSNLPLKRKWPLLKFDDESSTSPASSGPHPSRMELEAPLKTGEASSLRTEKTQSASPADENGSCGPEHDLVQPESSIQDADLDVVQQNKVKDELANLSSNSEESPFGDFNATPEEATVPVKAVPESTRGEKLSIDLMAPFPRPEKSSSEREERLDFVSDQKSQSTEKKLVIEPAMANEESDMAEKASKNDEILSSDKWSAEKLLAVEAGKFLAEDFDLKRQKSQAKTLELQLDLEKEDRDSLSFSCSSKQHQQQQAAKQQPKSAKVDSKREKPVQSTAMPLSVSITGWPGGFPSFGYMGPVPPLPAVVPVDGSSGSAKTVQGQMQQPLHVLQPPQLRPKRCATHCYIAQNIHYYQQIARVNPFWSSAAAAAAAAVGVPIYGAEQYNLNAVPALESAAILGNPLQGKAPPPVAMAYTGPPPKEKSLVKAAVAASSNAYMDAQRKQFLLQQTPQTAPSNMIHGPAFIFPVNQQPAVANRSGVASKPTSGNNNATPSDSLGAPAGSGTAGHSVTTMSFNYAGLSPNDAQYMAILQNSGGYPFPIATAQVGAPPPYRGATPHGMPFFNQSFYSPQQQQQQFQIMQQHLRQQQHQQPLAAQSQQGLHNPSTSSGSSTSQKQTQQSQRIPGSGAPAAASTGSNLKQPLHLLPPQARQLESEIGCEDSPSTADSSRASQAQTGMYNQNFALSMHPQNFALISPSAAALATTAGGPGGLRGENKQQAAAVHQHLQHQGVKVLHQGVKADLPQGYAPMSFASFGGSAANARPGLDFSAIVQNSAILSSHAYQLQAVAVAQAAAAAAAQAAQHKKAHHEDEKQRRDSAAANASAATEEGKAMAASTAAVKAGVGSVSHQHSLNFLKADNDTPVSTNTLSNLTEASPRSLNLIHGPANGSRVPNSSSNAATNTNSSAGTTRSPSPHHLPQQQQQQQQQMIQLRKQQQQMLQYQQQQLMQMSSRSTVSSNAHINTAANISSDRLPAVSAMGGRFPQGVLTGFPPSIIQGSSGSAQSPEWKASGRAATPAPASSATSSSSSAKNQISQQRQHQQQQQQQQPQQQGRIQQQQLFLTPGAHEAQISFGVTKPLGAGSSNSSLSFVAAAAIAAGSPQNSILKSSAAASSSNGGSPHTPSSSKPVQPPASVLSMPLQHQQPVLQLHQATAAAAASKSSSSAASSLNKSSSIPNRSTTSILGHPHSTPSNSNSCKLSQQQQSHQQQQKQAVQHSQQQQSHQQQQKQASLHSQLFFNSPYSAQASLPNAAAAAVGYYQQQRRQSEQSQQQQQQQNSTTSAMHSLSPASLKLADASTTFNHVKAAAAAAGSFKQAGILHHTTQFPGSSMAPHLMSAAFSYIHTGPSAVSVKPATAATDQKQSSAGNENLHACWNPEKR